MMQRKNTSLEDVAGRLTTAFDEMDDSRVKNIEETRDIQQVKKEARQRELNRLTSKYGSQHPRVIKTEARLALHQPVGEALNVETERAGITISPLEPDSWKLHGRVLNPDRTGIKDLTVSLQDQKNQWIRELGYDCTDERGYFTISYKQSPNDEDRQLGPMFITVTDKEKTLLYRDKEPITIVIGQIDYREIILGNEPCPEPGGDGSDGEGGNGENGENGDNKSQWIVTGSVTNRKSGRGFVGLTVSLFDMENQFTESLGNTKTKAKGIFELQYNAKDHPELFDKKPPLHLRVFNKAGKEMYTSKKALKIAAGKNEILEIKI